MVFNFWRKFFPSHRFMRTFFEDPPLVLLGHEAVGEGDEVVVLLHEGTQFALGGLGRISEQRAEDGALEVFIH